MTLNNAVTTPLQRLHYLRAVLALAIVEADMWSYEELSEAISTINAELITLAPDMLDFDLQFSRTKLKKECHALVDEFYLRTPK